MPADEMDVDMLASFTANNKNTKFKELIQSTVDIHPLHTSMDLFCQKFLFFRMSPQSTASYALELKSPDTEEYCLFQTRGAQQSWYGSYLLFF